MEAGTAIQDAPMRSPAPRRSRRAAAVLALFGVVLAGLSLLAMTGPQLYEVEARGSELLPYDSGVVYEVRILDSVTLYADGESRPRPDLFIGLALFAVAISSLLVALLLRALDAFANRRAIVFYGVAGAGAALLALDELLGIHETLGHNLRFLASLPGVERPDDAIFAAYALPAVAFVIYFRDVILGSRRAVRLFAAALALASVAMVGDAFLPAAIELSAEGLAVLAIVAGFVALLAKHVETALERARAGDGAHPQAASHPG